MYAFTLERPASVADAVKLAAAGAKPLAGGQTLLASMKLRLAAPGQLVDLGGIKELAGIKKEGNAFVIGAMTRHLDVGADAEIKAAFPALAWLADHIGDRQVRAMGTIGGSLANNDPAADYPAAVLALGATVKTNKRSISADDFFKGLFSTALEDGEIITAVSFPVHAKAGYSKFNHPASRFALTAVFVAGTPAGDVRVAATGASQDGVMRVPAIEAALKANWSAAAIDGVTISADGLMSDIHGTSDYRANLIKVMAQRAVTAAG
jgi:carbon-monoxide dehydrogenase medium subunit